MYNHRTPKFAIAVAMLSFIATALGDDVSQVVDVLFGEKIRKVLATISRADDVALASEMLEAIKGDTVTLAMQATLCEKASELAMRDTSGFAVALEAVKVWPVEGTAAEQAAAIEKQVEVLNRIHQTGKPADRTPAGVMLIDLLVRSGNGKMEANAFADAVASYRMAGAIAPRVKPEDALAIRSKLDIALHRERTARTIDQLRTKLLENRNDNISAETLVKLLIIETQDIETAKTYLDAVKDEELKKVVAQLGRPTSELSAAEAMHLAEWFKAASNGAKGHTLASGLTLAKANYEQVLAREDADNLAKTKATLQVKDIAAKLEKMQTPPVRITGNNPPRPPAADSKWIELIDLIDIKANIENGGWTKTRTGVAVDGKTQESQLIIPYKPVGDYQLSIKFTCKGGNVFDIHFPVGDGHVRLMLGNGSSAQEKWRRSGLRSVKGADYYKNETTVEGSPIFAGQVHTCVVTVKLKDKDADVQIELDGKRFISWAGAQSSLGYKYENWKLPDPSGMALGSFFTPAEFHEIKFRAMKE